MPDYTIRDPDTGRTVTLRGESPPTEAELETIFSQLGPSAQPEQQTRSQSFVTPPGMNLPPISNVQEYLQSPEYKQDKLSREMTHEPFSLGPYESTIKGVGVAAPILGATVGTMLVPQLTIPATAGRLASGGTAIANFLARVAGAGAGGATGGAVEQFITDPQSDLPQYGEQALERGKEMAAAQVVGEGLIKGASLALAPLAKGVTQAGKDIVAWARKYNVPLKPSAELKGPQMVTAKAIERTLEDFLPSRWVSQLQARKTAKFLEVDPGDLNIAVMQAARIHNQNSPGLEMTMQGVKGSLDKLIPAAKKQIQSQFDDVLKEVGPKTLTATPKLRQVFEAIKAAESRLPDGARDDGILKTIAAFEKKYPAQIHAEDLFDYMTKRFSNLDGNPHNLGQLREVLKQELDDISGGAKESLNKAFQNWYLSNTFFAKNRLIQQFMNGTITDDAFRIKLFSDNNIPVLNQLRNRLSSDDFNNLLRSNVEEMLQNFTYESGSFGTKYLDGKRILKWIDRNPKVFGMYPKDVQTAIENIAMYSTLMRPEVLLANKPFLDFESSLLSGGIAGPSLLAQTASPALVAGSATAPFMAKSIMNPNGLMHQWLTTGFLPSSPVAREAGKQAIQMIPRGAMANDRNP